MKYKLLIGGFERAAIDGSDEADIIDMLLEQLVKICCSEVAIVAEETLYSAKSSEDG